MRHILYSGLLVLAALILSACGGGESEDSSEVDPLALLTTASDLIRASDTIRLDVVQSGADYEIAITQEGERLNVSFRTARFQYVAPNMIQGTVRVIAGGVVPIDVDVFGFGERQWVRFVGGDWFEEFFAPGFDPETLMQRNSGFDAVLQDLRELEYVGVETLVDGTRAYHVRGIAEGPAVTALLVDLIDPTGPVPVEVWIDRETGYPARLVLETDLDEPGGDPTFWELEVYDIDASDALTPPDSIAGEVAEIRAARQ
jgi:hypothetical protein